MFAALASAQACMQSAPGGSHRRCGLGWLRFFALAGRFRATFLAFGFGAPRASGSLGKLQPTTCGNTRSRRQCWGAGLQHPTFAVTHRLTTHSSRSCFATRLNSSVRPWWSKSAGGPGFGKLAGVHAVGRLAVTVTRVGRARASPSYVVAVQYSLRLTSVASCVWELLGKLYLITCGTLGSGGSVGEHACNAQPLRPLVA
ncbi:hypothetical protein FHR47_002825 [Xanthomonas arboricola]|nr:hypothetical protein [Xanthomonas cannabis]